MDNTFNAKDYILDKLEEKTVDIIVSNPNFTVSLLEDGTKGFVINRAKKSMALRYEDAKFLDENGKEMEFEQVYAFMSSLNSRLIQIPPASGFTSILKGKNFVIDLYKLVQKSAIETHECYNLRNLVKNELTTIRIMETSHSKDPYRRIIYHNIDNDTLKRAEPILLKYMTKPELQDIVCCTTFDYPLDTELYARKIMLIRGIKSINTLLDYYSADEVFVYLDELFVSIQHTTLPSANTIRGLFEGFQRKDLDTDLPSLDMADGAFLSYDGNEEMSDGRREQAIYEKYYKYRESPDAYSTHGGDRFIFYVPSCQKVDISIQDFTQMAVYGAIAQGYTPEAVNMFLYTWRKFIDYELYYHGAITDSAPRNLLSATTVYDERTINILKDKVRDAYRTKRRFYEEQLKHFRLPIPYTLDKGLMLTLASERDVVEMVAAYYCLRDDFDKFSHIRVMLCSNSVPLSIISTRGVISTQFYDLNVITENKAPNSFSHNGREYSCARFFSSRYVYRSTWRMIHPRENPIHEYIGSQTPNMMMEGYFKQHMKKYFSKG